MKKILILLLILLIGTGVFALNKPRWLTLPIHVYVPQNAGSYSMLMNKAFRDWQSRTKGLVQFRYVHRQSEAHIYVKFVDRVYNCGSEFAVGCTRYENINAKGYFTQNYIEVGTNEFTVDNKGKITSTNKKYSSDSIYDILLHEIGHAVGLGHSYDKKSIMYPSMLSTPQSITKEDLKILEDKYR